MHLFFVPQFKQLIDGEFESITVPYSLFVLKEKEMLKAAPLSVQALQAFYELQNSEKKSFILPEVRNVTVWKFNSPVSAESKSKKTNDEANAFKKDLQRMFVYFSLALYLRTRLIHLSLSTMELDRLTHSIKMILPLLLEKRALFLK